MTPSRQRFDQGWRDLRGAYEQLESARVLLAQSADQIADGRAQLAEGQAELDRQRAEALAQLADAQQQLDDALAEIADGQAGLNEARATYESERADALDQIADARAEVEDIPDATWYVQDRSSLSSYASVESDASSIEAIGTVIPVVFFVVAVLISLTTMTRMVEEERGLIGVYKALGYSPVAGSLSKYALYALAACLVGGLAGNVLGFVALPAIIFTIFSTMYALPGFLYGFDALWALAAVGLFAAGIVGATLLTCWQELKESPASLMRPKAPKAGSRVFLEYVGPVWRRLSFLQKVTARNLLRYKRRFLMTVFGIAGCVALLITGFGIRDTVISLSGRQYGDAGVIGYDLMVVTGLDDLDSAADDLLASDDVSDLVRVYIDSLTVTSGEKKESVQLVVVPDSIDLAGYVRLTSDAGGEVALGSSGAEVAITKNAEQVMGVACGSEVELQDSTLAEGTATVDEIVLSYLGNTLYMTEGAYERAFGEELDPTGFSPPELRRGRAGGLLGARVRGRARALGGLHAEARERLLERVHAHQYRGLRRDRSGGSTRSRLCSRSRTPTSRSVSASWRRSKCSASSGRRCTATSTRRRSSSRGSAWWRACPWAMRWRARSRGSCGCRRCILTCSWIR